MFNVAMLNGKVAIMAGHVFTRGFCKCPRKGSLLVVSRRGKLNLAFQNKIHTSPTRRLPTLSVLTYQHFTVTSSSVVSSQGGRRRFEANGFHTTSCVASTSSWDTTPISLDASNVKPGESLLDSSTLASNDISLISPFDTTPDILTSGIAEPALSSLGLGSYYPPGLLQQGLEFLHVSLDLPWWGAIVCGTFIARMLVFPLMIYVHRNAGNMAKGQPEIDALKEKWAGNSYQPDPTQPDMSLHTELNAIYKKHDSNPLKTMIPMLSTGVIFISFFWGIRGMTDLPVEALKTGGAYWFTNLTMADPYFILPVVCATTMFISLELGADTGNLMMPPHMKNVMRGMSFMIIPITCHFPAGLNLYWVVSNLFSCTQGILLKQKSVKKFFGIAEVKLPVVNLPGNGNLHGNSKLGFVNSFQNGLKNAKAEEIRKLKLEQSQKHDHVANPRLARNEKLFAQAMTKRRRVK